MRGTRKAQEGHDLREAGSGEAFAAGDGGMGLDLACVELALPFLGEPQELGGAGATALLRRRGAL